MATGVSRRGLLKVLGLGGVGLVTGTAVAKVIQEENKRLGRTPVQREMWADDATPEWVHPDMDKIESILNLTGGYPGMFGRFPQGSVLVNNADRLNINYTISNDYGPDTVLYRVYDCVMCLTVIGTAIQGPVIEDRDAPDGHRLATIEELIPNEELSRRHYD